MQEGQPLYSSYLVPCILNAFLCYTAYTAICAMGFKQVSHNDPTYQITFIAFVIPSNFVAAVSFLNVMALIADRFLVIHLHLRYQDVVTHKLVVAVVILIWVFSATFSLIRLLIPKNIFYASGGFIGLACLLTTTFFSVKICFAVRRQMNEIQILQVHQVAQPGEMANMIRLRKFAIAAVYVYLVFLVCYLPHACVQFATPFFSASSNDIGRLHVYSQMLVYLNSSLNPLIYCWKMKNIRHTIMNILRNTFLNHN